MKRAIVTVGLGFGDEGKALPWTTWFGSSMPSWWCALRRQPRVGNVRPRRHAHVLAVRRRHPRAPAATDIPGCQRHLRSAAAREAEHLEALASPTRRRFSHSPRLRSSPRRGDGS